MAKVLDQTRREIVRLTLLKQQAIRHGDERTAHECHMEREIMVYLARRLQDKHDTGMAIILPEVVA